ncbi:MAG: HlyD family secretion protein, partial [Candidatus Eisenbacteria bacterium]
MSTNPGVPQAGTATVDPPTAAPRPQGQAPTAAPERPAPPVAPVAKTNGSRRPVVLVVLAVLALLGIGWGVRQYLWGRSHVRTDDAQVEGHVVPVLAKVTGYVTQVPVVDNQMANAGELL